MKSLGLLFVLLPVIAAPARADEQRRLPLIDTHIHYSENVWADLQPEQAIDILRSAGLKKAFVSSSGDDGTLALYAMAPELIVPVLRPYRHQGELSRWLEDESVIDMLEKRLSRNPYAGIGEFHAFGDDVDLPVVRQVVDLARRHGLFLHAHSDSDAVTRIFAQDPDAIVLWAHSGFEGPTEIADMLDRFPRLWADLAFRTEHLIDGYLEPEWRELFERFPGRFVVGTDTFSLERWFEVEEHAALCRQWLADLPAELATAIGAGNANGLLELTDWQRADRDP